MHTDSKKHETPTDANNVLADTGFIRGKVKLPQGKYKHVYSYKMPNGTIKHQSFISKYKWSAYHETEKAAAIAVDKYLLQKGLKPINVLVPV